MHMLFADRARRRLAVRLAGSISLSLVVACASRHEDDLFDSTPNGPTGSPSGGRVAATGGSASGGTPLAAPSSGGMPGISLPQTGGAGAGTVEPSAGKPAKPPAEATGGATSSTGGMPPSGGNGGSGGVPDSGMGGVGGIGGIGGAPSGGSGGTPSNIAGGGSGGSTGGAPACEPHTERCDGVDNDCDGETDEGKACPEGCEGFSDQSGKYMLCTEDATTATASTTCSKQEMHLAWVETANENQFLLETISKLMNVDPTHTASGDDQAQVRLGGTDQEDDGIWSWTAAEQGPTFWKQSANAEEPWEGEAASGMFANWSERRPNEGGSSGEDCLVMTLENGDDGDAGQWNDVGCATRHPFVCEVPSIN